MPKLLDLTGRTFGRLTVKGPAPRGEGGPAWNTRCTCGTLAVFSSKVLLAGFRMSCDCAMRIDLVGRHFGMLTVKAVAPRIPNQQGVRWLCDCMCGRQSLARAKDLKSGNTTSCGCRVNRLVVSRGELTPRQLAALSAIGRARDGLPCVELVELLGVCLSSVHRNVRRLVERGLVERRHVGHGEMRGYILPAGVDVLFGRDQYPQPRMVRPRAA